MRLRVLALICPVLVLTSKGFAETVVDVSKEWQTHASSSPAAQSISPSVGNSVGGANPAAASDDPSCECETLTPHERLEQSTLAFTGRVAESTRAKKGKRTIVFDVDEIFKGSPGMETKVMVDVTGTPCDLPFDENQSYVVFARWEWGKMLTSRCMGTKFLEKAKVSALGPDQERKEKMYIGLRNMCMGRRDTPCCLASLKAMRQEYYVPEPEEGCSEGTVPDRLRCAGSYTWCIPYSEKSHRPEEH